MNEIFKSNKSKTISNLTKVVLKFFIPSNRRLFPYYWLLYTLNLNLACVVFTENWSCTRHNVLFSVIKEVDFQDVQFTCIWSERRVQNR